MKEQTTAQGV